MQVCIYIYIKVPMYINWSILKNLWVVLQEGSLPPGSWSGNIVNRKPPRGGVFFRSTLRSNWWCKPRPPASNKNSKKTNYRHELTTNYNLLHLECLSIPFSNLNLICLLSTERGKKDVENSVINWGLRLEIGHSTCNRHAIDSTCNRHATDSTCNRLYLEIKGHETNTNYRHELNANYLEIKVVM